MLFSEKALVKSTRFHSLRHKRYTLYMSPFSRHKRYKCLMLFSETASAPRLRFCCRLLDLPDFVMPPRITFTTKNSCHFFRYSSHVMPPWITFTTIILPRILAISLDIAFGALMEKLPYATSNHIYNHHHFATLNITFGDNMNVGCCVTPPQTTSPLLVRFPNSLQS